ncbi:NrsF family protein [Paracoccus sp. NSM]|uniref:NrsF family protein n=1 Tax=Paracoccus sp. NSM TaxID=3457784 RepID=UPI0040350324
MTQRPATDELIRSLAASPAPPPLTAAIARPMLLALVLSLGAFLLVAGPRADLAQAVLAPEVLAKLLLPLVVAATALVLALRSARPATRIGGGALLVPAAAALAILAATLARTAPGSVLPALIGGGSPAGCLAAITALSAPAIIAGLALFRRGASLRPARTGALIGIAASAGAASGYALYCTEDSPLFFITWYGLAILIAAAAGALAGQRLLRW